MAPLQPKNKGPTDERLQTVLDSAERILNLLKNRVQVHATFAAELETLIERAFALPTPTFSSAEPPVLDSLGTGLWNAATNYLRDHEDDNEQPLGRLGGTRLVAMLRVFAFTLLDTSYRASKKRTDDNAVKIRNLKIGLKACRFCLDKGELGLALKLLERLSDHVSAVEDSSPLVRIADVTDEANDGSSLKALAAEFYLLRVTHAWKSKRLDLAEHFFRRVDHEHLQASASLARKAADLFYEAGKSLAREFGEPAVEWLERALQALDARKSEQFEQDARQLRLRITSALVDALLSFNDSESVKQASHHVEQLQVTYGLDGCITLQWMRLKIFCAEQVVDVDKLSEVLSRMLQYATLHELSFVTIMHALHRARKANTAVACRALGEFITARLLPIVHNDQTGIHTWLEKACVTYIHFATNEPANSQRSLIQGLEETCSAIVRNRNRFSTRATHAAQMLLWKAAGIAEPDDADKWCSLLRHPLFDGAGPVNKAKIGRKAMTMAMSKGDFNGAREAFYQIPDSARDESITRYVSFRLALSSNDISLAHESLGVIVKQARGDPTFLYACVLEAQQSEMRQIAVTALQAILDAQPPGVHLPSLLRCTARLLVGELGLHARGLDEVMEEVLRVFENAAAKIQAFKQGRDDQFQAEIQWWSKNAYNLSLRLCGDAHPEHLLRLLHVCTLFLENAEAMGQDELIQRQSLCRFLSASANIVLARSGEEGSEHSLQYFLQARQEICAFRSLHRKSLARGLNNSTNRILEILKFELECTLNLQEWDQLDTVLQACLDIESNDKWDTLADLVLIIQKQVATHRLSPKSDTLIPALLQKIINETWKSDKNIIKVARWLRLSFAVDLDDGRGNFALSLLEQAASMAKKGANGKTAGAFPEAELQWLAATAFNRAVDLLAAGDDMTAAPSWIEGALELARHAADNGALHANLTTKRKQAVERMRERAGV